MIKEWTDYGMDWANPDPLQAKYWEAVRLALFTRYIPLDIVNYWDYYLSKPFWGVDFSDLACHGSLLGRLQTALFFIIPKYINHTLSTPLGSEEQWDKNTIFSAISAERIYEVNQYELIESAKDLLIQMYKIINMLREFKRGVLVGKREAKDILNDWNASFDDEWAIASAQYDTMPWNAEKSSYPNPVSRGYGSKRYSWEQKHLGLNNARIEYIVSDVVWKPGTEVDFVIYLYDRQDVWWHGLPFNGGITEFTDNGFYKTNTQVLAGETYKHLFEFTKSPKPIDPYEGLNYWFYSFGYSIQGGSPYLIVKHNFDFKD